MDNLSKGTELYNKICEVLKTIDIELYNKFMDNNDNFKWSIISYLAFVHSSDTEQAIKNFIETYKKIK